MPLVRLTVLNMNDFTDKDEQLLGYEREETI
jgi:hypothetical protein